MVISEQQLDVWASAPSATEMQKIQNTRNVIENVLKQNLPIDEIKRANSLTTYDYQVYLQGSYANSTNVRYDSDVDIVVQLNNPFFYDASGLSPDEKRTFELSHSNAQYKFAQFKADIFNALKNGIGVAQVHFGDKCINVDGNTYRTEADVVPCLQYRLYKRFVSYSSQHYVEGIKFFDTSTDEEIINYPKIHIRNCESKNVDTGGKYKDLVRIYKNMRNKLAENHKIDVGVAPSYYIENLLYNCSSQCFDGNYTNCMFASFQYIYDAIQAGRITGFICANEQHTLIGEKTWNLSDLISYVNEMANYFIGKITI